MFTFADFRRKECKIIVEHDALVRAISLLNSSCRRSKLSFIPYEISNEWEVGFMASRKQYNTLKTKFKAEDIQVKYRYTDEFGMTVFRES